MCSSVFSSAKTGFNLCGCTGDILFIAFTRGSTLATFLEIITLIIFLNPIFSVTGTGSEVFIIPIYVWTYLLDMCEQRVALHQTTIPIHNERLVAKLY